MSLLGMVPVPRFFLTATEAVSKYCGKAKGKTLKGLSNHVKQCGVLRKKPPGKRSKTEDDTKNVNPN